MARCLRLNEGQPFTAAHRRRMGPTAVGVDCARVGRWRGEERLIFVRYTADPPPNATWDESLQAWVLATSRGGLSLP